MDTANDNKVYFEGRGGRVAVTVEPQEPPAATQDAAPPQESAATDNAAEVVLKTFEFSKGDGFRWRQNIETTPNQSM